MRLADSVEIARPPGDVYAYLADPSNLPDWQGAVDEVRWQGGEASQGDRFEEARSFIGKRATSTVEVTAAEPGREFSVAVVEGPVKVAARHLLEESGEGTALRVQVEAEGVPRLVAGMAARAARRQTRQDLARLRDLLEA